MIPLTDAVKVRCQWSYYIWSDIKLEFEGSDIII